MKSNVCRFAQNQAISEAMLREVNKTAAYNDLDKKNTLRLNLLAEELIGMLPNFSDGYKGEFWIENDGTDYELHAALSVEKFTLDTGDRILSLSKNGKNAAAKGIIGKIRSVIGGMLAADDIAELAGYEVFSSGTMDLYPGYTHCWSLNQYQNAVENSSDSSENKEAWDEFEKSVITKIADDVIVGIMGRKVDIIVRKSF